MKKFLFFVLAVMMLFVIAVPAYAVSWGDPAVTSPYSVAVIPVRQRTVFGQKYLEQFFGTAAAGDDIHAAIRVEVPENPRPGTLTVKAQNAVLDCAITASLPMTRGVYYLTSTGGFTAAFTVVDGYATGTPTITATITGTERITNVGPYSIARSDGYIITTAGKGMQFCPDARGKVYAAYVIRPDGKHKLTPYVLTEDSEEGVIARDVLRVLSIDGSALLNGGIYMTDRLLAANFGLLVDVEVSKTWGASDALPVTSPTPAALSVLPVAEIPDTGWETDAFVIGGVCVLSLLVWAEHRNIEKFIKAANQKKDDRRTD